MISGGRVRRAAHFLECACHWSKCPIGLGDGKSPVWIVQRRSGLPVLQHHHAHPRPFTFHALHRAECVTGLLIWLDLSPDRRLAAPSRRQRVPSKMTGPQRLARIAVRDHFFAHQDDVRKVEHVRADAPVVRAGGIAIRFAGGDVEILARASLVQLPQVEPVAHVLARVFDGGRQPGQEDDGVRVVGEDRLARLAQHLGVGGGVHLAVPAVAQVRLVPDLVIVNPVAIAPRELARKVRKIGWVERRIVGLGRGRMSLRPCRRRVEHRDQFRFAQCVDDPIPRGPIELCRVPARSWPRGTSGAPTKIDRADFLQVLPQGRVVVLFERDVDAPTRQVGIGDGLGKTLRYSTQGDAALRVDHHRRQHDGNQPQRTHNREDYGL